MTHDHANPPTSLFRHHLRAVLLAAGVAAAGGACSSSTPASTGLDADSGAASPVVINEVYPNGTSIDDTDWIELKNTGATVYDLTGFELRDEKLANRAPLPDHTTIEPGGYLVIKCVHPPEGGVVDGLYVPFKLSDSSGDEVHLIGVGGADVDSTIFGDDIPSDKSWARLPDGTGTFVRATPTKGASNL